MARTQDWSWEGPGAKPERMHACRPLELPNERHASHGLTLTPVISDPEDHERESSSSRQSMLCNAHLQRKT